MENCPINIERIVFHANEMESFLPYRIDPSQIDRFKMGIMKARASFDSMVSILIQTLQARDTLREAPDKVIFSWLTDNFGRYLKRLDEEEYKVVVSQDDPNPRQSLVGVSRILNYSRLLQTSVDSIIYEGLYQSTMEWQSLEETERIRKDKRTFLYILFQNIQVSMAIMGSITREGPGRKTSLNTMPLSYGGLLSPQGQEVISTQYKKSTGKKVSDIQSSLELLQQGEDDIFGEEDNDGN